MNCNGLATLSKKSRGELHPPQMDALYSAAYEPPFLSNSSWVPNSVIVYTSTTPLLMSRRRKGVGHYKRTPRSIIAILSARRAVESRWVTKMTVFVLLPDGDPEIRCMVSKILFCACASSDDVCQVLSVMQTRDDICTAGVCHLRVHRTAKGQLPVDQLA